MSAEIEIISVMGAKSQPLPIHGTGFGSTCSEPVKQERDDDAEIQKMATQMKEANIVALAKQQRQAAHIAARLAMDNTNNGQQEPANDSSTSTPCDERSQMGHFGWATFDLTYIPYIYRQQEKYCSVRMIEMKLIGKYLNCLHPDICTRCACVRSYYITEAEARLLNEINQIHCVGDFGLDMFMQNDLVVRLSDATEFYKFLDVCYKKLVSRGKFPCVKCGFMLINNESVVPYTLHNGEQVVPLFYFEGETENLKQKANYLSGWEVPYLKFCFTVQGIRHDLFSTKNIAVISVTDLKSYFPNGTEFEDHWPSKVVDLKILIINRQNATNPVHWTRKPSQPPHKVLTQSTFQEKQQQHSNAVQAVHFNATHQQLRKRGSATAAAAAASALDNGQNLLQQPGAAAAAPAQRMHKKAAPAAQAQPAAAAHQQLMKRGASAAATSALDNAQNLLQQPGAAAAAPAQRMHKNAAPVAQAQPAAAHQELMKRGASAAATSALDNAQNLLQQPGAAAAAPAQRMHKNAAPAAQAQPAVAHQELMKRGASAAATSALDNGQNLPQQAGAAAAAPAQRMHSNAAPATQAQALPNGPMMSQPQHNPPSIIYINEAAYAHLQHNVRNLPAGHHASNNGQNVAAAESADQIKSKKQRMNTMNST